MGEGPEKTGFSNYGAVSGLGDDNIICDFIPVLEITSRL